MSRKSKAKRAAKAALKNFAARRGPPPAPPVVVVQQRKKKNKRRNRSRQGAKSMNSNLVMKLGKTATAIAGGVLPWTKPIIEAGVDFLATLTGGGTNMSANVDGTFGAPGNVVANFTVAPGALPNTRLQLMAQLYQRYFFNRVTVKYMPAIGVTSAGQLIGYFDTDPEDNPPTGLAAINYANAHGGVLFQISESANFSMPVIKDRTYYTSTTDPLDEERFKIQAIFRVIQVTTLPGAPLGSFSVDYNCTMELPAVVTGSGPVPPESYYTTSIVVGVTSSATTQTNVGLCQVFSFPVGTLPVQWSTQYAAAIILTPAFGIGYNDGTKDLPLITPGFYDIYISVNLTLGNMSFSAPSGNSWFNGQAGGFTITGATVHYTSSTVSSGDAFAHYTFQCTSGSAAFNPIINTVGAAGPALFMLLYFSPTAIEKKLHQSNISKKIDEIDMKISKLDMLINSAQALQRPFQKLPPLVLGDTKSYESPDDFECPSPIDKHRSRHQSEKAGLSARKQ